ncbi:MAG: AAA family ATPase, partial [Bacteroidales bacterium]|nr:AAA family ATPase [Bacteroidales bacterium]
METGRKRLPLGLQTFTELIEENYIYVDKTKYLVDMIDRGKLYFFTRPRRFGKTLTVSTLEALFQGRKELFKGLYAEEWLNRAEFQPSPVIRLDMNSITTGEGVAVMKKSLLSIVQECGENNGVILQTTSSVGDAFRELIRSLYKKCNSKVVILIDEYDKPLLDNLFKSKELIETIKEFLSDFYTQVKANEQYIKFVFLTGISKIARVGVFSKLNNLTDISFRAKYGEMCGYTEEEIKTYFTDYLQDTANAMNITTDELMDKIRNYYDGFCFDGIHRMYNPYSTLLFFDNKDFDNYWFESGTPSVIANYLKDKRLTVEQFRNLPVSKEFARNPGEIDNASPEKFLYQSGYLTLREGTTNDYSLDYPNTEVLNAMSKLLTQNFVENDYNYLQEDLRYNLQERDKEGLKDVFNKLLASIPYDDYKSAAKQGIQLQHLKIPVQEWLYRTSILAFLRGCGI